MKNTGRTFFCLLVAVALVLGSLAWGARKGWQAEANELQSLYEQDGGLKSLLELRYADASNLLSVARRYMDKQDDRIKAVAAARDVLHGNDSLEKKYKANFELTEAVDALSNALQSQPALEKDTKDWNYVISLTKALEAYAEGDAVNAYNFAVNDFNQRMSQSFSGLLAGAMGIPHAQTFDMP